MIAEVLLPVISTYYLQFVFNLLEINKEMKHSIKTQVDNQNSCQCGFTHLGNFQLQLDEKWPILK